MKKIVLVYQDRDSVEQVIESLKVLDIDFVVYSINSISLNKLQEHEPEILLIATNSASMSIEYYDDFLSSIEQFPFQHSAILLVNNKESAQAYLACQRGMFDDYCVINPYNEPYRLNLIILKTLELVDNSDTAEMSKLLGHGNDSLAEVIEHGSTMKSQLLQSMDTCQSSISEAISDSPKTTQIIEQIIAERFNDFKQLLITSVDEYTEQLLDVQGVYNTIVKATQQQQTRQNFLKDVSTFEQEVESNLQKRVLVFEPKADYEEILKQWLTEANFDTYIFSTTNKIVEKIVSYRPDAIMLGYNLTPVNGIDALRLIKQAGIQAPVIAFSEQQSIETKNAWFPLGLAAYLTKPSDQETLVSVIEHHIKIDSQLHQYATRDKKQIITWSDSFSVGDQLMDEHHQQLIAIVNEFVNLTDMKAVPSIISKIFKYTELHFKAEEQLMKNAHYPASQEHEAQHQALIKKAQQISAKIQSFDKKTHTKIGEFLAAWLTEHILHSDMDYKPYVEKYNAQLEVVKDS